MSLPFGKRPFNLAANGRGGTAFPFKQAQLIPQADDLSLFAGVHDNLLRGAIVNETGTIFKPSRCGRPMATWNTPPVRGLSFTGGAIRPQRSRRGPSAPEPTLSRTTKKKQKMPYIVTGTDIRGVNTARRRTPEMALKKAREFIAHACYNVRITTPEGRTYHSAQFGDLPHTPAATRPSRKRAPAR